MRTGWAFAALLLLGLPACEEVEEILEEPTPAADTIESGSFDRLWDAAHVVLRKDCDIVGEDRACGRILGRGRPAESYVHRGERQYYSDMTSIVVEVRIDRRGATNVLSVRAAQENEAFGPEMAHRHVDRGRSYVDMPPSLMRVSGVEQAILRALRKEVQGAQ